MVKKQRKEEKIQVSAIKKGFIESVKQGSSGFILGLLGCPFTALDHHDPGTLVPGYSSGVNADNR